MCFCNLIFSQANFKSKTEASEIFLSFFLLTIILQNYSPWEIQYSLIPIILSFLVSLTMTIKNGGFPRKNWRLFGIGITIIGFGVWVFSKSTNENEDYLRLYHHIWHLMCGGFGGSLVFLSRMEISNEKSVFDLLFKWWWINIWKLWFFVIF